MNRRRGRDTTNAIVRKRQSSNIRSYECNLIRRYARIFLCALHRFFYHTLAKIQSDDAVVLAAPRKLSREQP